MATRIINQPPGQQARMVPTPPRTTANEVALPCEDTNEAESEMPTTACGGSCTRSVEFCETMTLPAPFNTDAIKTNCARIAYDTSFLGYTVEPESVQAQLPCGGCCPVDVFRIGLAGAIPYIIDIGPVSSACGDTVRVNVTGNVMVDEAIGYICGGTEPELNELSCQNVTPHLCVEIADCGCTDNSNITVYGTFSFSNLPTCM